MKTMKVLNEVKIYEVEKKGMMKHSVMTLNEKECDNIWGENSIQKWTDEEQCYGTEC